MSNQYVQRIAIKAVIVNSENKVLLLREADTYVEGTNRGRFHFPGGRLEPGEVWQDGLTREVQEETGLNVEIIRPVFVGEWRPTIKGQPHHIVGVFMLCSYQDQEIVLSSEHDGYEWVDEESLKGLDIMTPDIDALICYLDSSSD